MSGLVCSFLFSLSLCAFAQLLKLREVDLSGWDCLSKLEDAAKTPDSSERNRQKKLSETPADTVEQRFRPGRHLTK
jgi:hypothetical protein